MFVDQTFRMNMSLVAVSSSVKYIGATGSEQDYSFLI